MTRALAIVPALPLFVLLALLGAPLCRSALAQDEEPDQEQAVEETEPNPFHELGWNHGPTTQAVGEIADLHLPEGVGSLGKEDTRRYIELTGNIASDELALVAPEDGDWWIDFSFSDVGYVKDDEKDDLDADALLAALKEGTEATNETRRERGFQALSIDGWEVAPYYDDQLKALSWATRISGEHGDVTVNHSARILGRRGMIVVSFVASPEEYRPNLERVRTIIKSLQFRSGQRYGDFREGDKIAEYGLAALVTGGLLAIGAKSGLLSKIWKLLVVAVVAVGAFFKKMLGRGGKTGKKKSRGRRPGTASTMTHDE